MKGAFLIPAIIAGIVIIISATLVYAASTYEPFVSAPARHHPIVRCPACHLVKRPPSECSHETQSWAWNECVLIEYLNPKSGVQ